MRPVEGCGEVRRCGQVWGESPAPGYKGPQSGTRSNGECTNAEGWAPAKSSLNAPVEDPKASRTLRRGEGEGSGNPNARRWEEGRKPSPRRSASIGGAKDRKSVPPGRGSTKRNMRKTHRHPPPQGPRVQARLYLSLSPFFLVSLPYQPTRHAAETSPARKAPPWPTPARSAPPSCAT